MPKYAIGQPVSFLDAPAVVRAVRENGAAPHYEIASGDVALPLLVPEEELSPAGAAAAPEVLFNRRTPALLSVDRFYQDPDRVRRIALQADYRPNPRGYKGLRSTHRYLFPYLREEFERLLGVRITDWLQQPANGLFQMTGYRDPLVYHSDLQSYAAAIYLTPDTPPSAGTSFWRDRSHGCRRPPFHALERDRFADDAERVRVRDAVYTPHNVTHPDNWELIDRIGAVYNRLLIWDAQLIHSASSYQGMAESGENSRLVQLFFFTIAE